MTSTEIHKRLGVSYKASLNLKRRIQLFASEVLPRMEAKFYSSQLEEHRNFNFPKDREENLTDIIVGKNIPQADTVVLYSASQRANKGRKRYKRSGQTASIYLSEALGGLQVGTLVNTFGVKQGPSFWDSIPNQQIATINPILGKYIPVHNPIFTDMGYRGYAGRNHRMVNHNLKSEDSRYKWSRERYSKNGIHCQVAEGLNGLIKKHFSAYTWVNPKYSQLYLNEYSFMRNLKFYGLEELLPNGTEGANATPIETDRSGSLRVLVGRNRPLSSLYIPRNLAQLVV